MVGEKIDDKDKVGIAAPVLYTLAFVSVSYAILSALEGEGTWVLVGLILTAIFVVAGYFASSTWRRRSERRTAVAPRGAKPPAEPGGTEPLPPREVQAHEATETLGEDQRP